MRDTFSGEKPSLVLLRDDFRVTDNPALYAAWTTKKTFLCIYVHESITELQGAIAWWLSQARTAFANALRQRGGELIEISGSAPDIIPDIVNELQCNEIFWNRRYDLQSREQDTLLKSRLEEAGCTVYSFPGRLLHEPWVLRTGSNQPYKVFTPWWRALQQLGAPGRCLPEPPSAPHFATWPEHLNNLKLSPATVTRPEGADTLETQWFCSEAAAHDLLKTFLATDLVSYKTTRDRPDKKGTSCLSPYLRAGLISARQVWHATEAMMQEKPYLSESGWTFLSEIGWRDFAWTQFFHHPDMADKNLRTEFDHMPWQNDDTLFEAWKKGRTGYPLVDAGMRQLYATGWMHNRVRMVTASFLTKHLLTDWRKGERWFRERLIDADPAQNAMNWQWCAGTGIDASPWFRIFNPIKQSETFDPTGAYIRQWIPELNSLSDNKLIHTPWKARTCNAYPAPVVDLTAARTRALEHYKNLP